MADSPKEKNLKNFLKKVPKMGVNFSYIIEGDITALGTVYHTFHQKATKI
jgi:hypothetical protein